MQATLSLINTLLPMLYGIAAIAYAVDFFREDPMVMRGARPILAGTVTLHALYLPALRSFAALLYPAFQVFGCDRACKRTSGVSRYPW